MACCYVAREDDAKDAEFGGIIVTDAWKGTGLASAIGTVAIAAHFLQDSTPLIAHVHVDNTAPIPLLTERLGFSKAEGKDVALNKTDLERRIRKQIAMRADANGLIRGHTYFFSAKALGDFATRLESGTLAKKRVHVVSKYFDSNAVAESVRLLRERAKTG